MEVVFSCSSCKQQLEAESTMSGTAINCPACGASIVIPELDAATARAPAAPPPADEKHFVVPVTDRPTASLIQKAHAPLEVAAKREGRKQMQVKCIRHTDCVEVGKDRFDEIVSKFLDDVGEENVVNISMFNYTHIDMGTRALLTDYGIMIVYKG